MTEKITSTEGYLSTDALKIILTGPVQISNPLDFSQKTTAEYQRIQKAVEGEMNKAFPLYHWEIPVSDDGQKYAMGSGGTGKAHNPPHYLECAINCDESNYNWEEYNFVIEEIDIKFYEFGFLTVSVSFAISSNSDDDTNKHEIRSDAFLRIVNELDNNIVNGKVEQIEALVSDITEKYMKAIKKNDIKEFFTNQNISNEATNKSRKNIKSLHRIIEYEVDKSSEIEVAKKAFNQIARLSNGEWQEENSFSHFVGVANSVIVYDGSMNSNAENIDSEIFSRYRNAYKTVLETANAYYFIAEFMKNGLSDYSRESVVIEESKKLFKSRKSFDEAETGLNKFILLTSNFFSVADEFIVNLNPQGQNVWDRMDKVWNTSKTTKMLQDQLQNSLLITDRILKQTANKGQKWLNIFAFVFAAIGAISLVEISQSDGFDWEFDINIWNIDNIDELTSASINLFGAFLAVLFVLAVIGAFLFSIYIVVKKITKLLSKKVTKK